MGQKITEYPQVDLWVKLMKEVDKTGAKVPYRESSDLREVSKYAEMDRARHRSSYTVNWSPKRQEPSREEDRGEGENA